MVEHRSPKPGVAGSIPASPARKEIMINKIKIFFEGVQFEMQKVSWPTWDELRGSTFVVLGLSLILSIFLFFVDFFLSRIASVVL